MIPILYEFWIGNEHLKRQKERNKKELDYIKGLGERLKKEAIKPEK